MKIIIKKIHHLTKADLQFIRKQLKEKGLKIKDIYKSLGISRTYLYDQLYDNRACSKDLLTYFETHGIKTYYEEILEVE